MKHISQQKIVDYVETNIPQFHSRRLENLLALKLEDLLTWKNPYSFWMKDSISAGECVRNALDGVLSSSELERYPRIKKICLKNKIC